MEIENRRADFFVLNWKRATIVLLIFMAFFFYRSLINQVLGISFKIITIIYTITAIYFGIYLIYILFVHLKLNKKEKMKRKKDRQSIFLLNWKKLFVVLSFIFFSIVLHNLIYAIFIIDEPVFFIISVIIIPFYLITSIIYSIVIYFKNKPIEENMKKNEALNRYKFKNIPARKKSN